MNKKLFIFTLATSVYNGYIDDQIKTIDNVFPNISEKYYILITDNKELYNKEDILSKTSLTNVFIYEILDMITDLVLVNKINYIYQTLIKSKFQYSNDDLFLFVDADTKFLQKENIFWNEFLDNILNYDLFITKYPLSYFKGEYEQAKNSREREGYQGYYHLDENVKCIQTSLWGGTIQMMINLYNDMYLEMLKHDLQDHIFNRHIPVLHEESYMMQVVNDNPNNYQILSDNFSTIIYCSDYKKDPWNLTDYDMITFFPNAIALQKYDWSKKQQKHQSLHG